MKNFCIVANSDKDKNFEIARNIVKIIEEAGGTCCIASKENYEFVNNGNPTNMDFVNNTTECALVLGGDGTIIQAAKDFFDKDIPLLGINLGTLGFLAETELSNIHETVQKLINDEYTIEDRFMLRGTIESSGNTVFSDNVLNDVVVGRTGFSRIISCKVFINDELCGCYHGDGVIVSTPTGSTGYNLSAGGPIVKPDSKLTVITPICSHALNSRSIVTDMNDTIRIKILESKKTQKDEAIATFDGRTDIKLKAGDVIEINRSAKTTKLMKMSKAGFFDVIRDKL
jgi:NAD+ kinase